MCVCWGGETGTACEEWARGFVSVTSPQQYRAALAEALEQDAYGADAVADCRLRVSKRMMKSWPDSGGGTEKIPNQPAQPLAPPSVLHMWYHAAHP